MTYRPWPWQRVWWRFRRFVARRYPQHFEAQLPDPNHKENTT